MISSSERTNLQTKCAGMLAANLRNKTDIRLQHSLPEAKDAKCGQGSRKLANTLKCLPGLYDAGWLSPVTVL